jgi:hypothetical protein
VQKLIKHSNHETLSTVVVSNAVRKKNDVDRIQTHAGNFLDLQTTGVRTLAAATTTTTATQPVQATDKAAAAATAAGDVT